MMMITSFSSSFEWTFWGARHTLDRCVCSFLFNCLDQYGSSWFFLSSFGFFIVRFVFKSLFGWLHIPSDCRAEQGQEVPQGKAVLMLYTGQGAQQGEHHHRTLGQRLEKFAQTLKSVKVVQGVSQTLSNLERQKEARNWSQNVICL